MIWLYLCHITRDFQNMNAEIKEKLYKFIFQTFEESETTYHEGCCFLISLVLGTLKCSDYSFKESRKLILKAVDNCKSQYIEE